MAKANTDTAASPSPEQQIIAGLRELIDMQAELLEEKDREIDALKRVMSNRERAAARRSTA